jgi:hypothetical protein
VIDGNTVVDGGPWAALGVLPSAAKVVEAVRDHAGGAGEPDPGGEQPE